jgi:hypothetical protein
MVPDHAVPGLDQPVSLSEYAKLEGLREADVLAVIGQLKIPAAFFRGQWWVEAPPNSEARLAQLRGSRSLWRHTSFPRQLWYHRVPRWLLPRWLLPRSRRLRERQAKWWTKALKTIGLILAMIAATFAIGLLQPLAVVLYLYVMAPLYHWLGLRDTLSRLLFCTSMIFVGIVAYVWISLQLDKRRSKKDSTYNDHTL